MKINDLTHEIANKLHGICVIAGCLQDTLNSDKGISVPLKEEIIKGLNSIEAAAQNASLELNEIKKEFS